MRRVIKISLGKLAIILLSIAFIVSVLLTANMEVSTGSAVKILEAGDNVTGDKK